MKPKYSIFYSWQSDLPKDTNLNAIRHVLREAANQIENDVVDTIIEIDEATRETTGSPNIPQTIFDKVTACDIFICDLTTINSKTAGAGRKVPNPNVLIELGFAISVVGWDRIIMLFNKNHGSFPDDLPFDIDRHRGTPFSIKDKKDTAEKNRIISILKDAIQSIIQKAPLKPSEKSSVSPDQRKREIDVKNLKYIFNYLHIPTFDDFLSELPDRFPGKIFFFYESFVSVAESSSFHLYDQTLLKLINEFKDNWVKILSYGEHYGPDLSGWYYKFHMVMDTFQSEKAEKDFKDIRLIRIELKKQFKSLLAYIRTKYLEIDLDETSKNAFDLYKAEIENEK